MQIVHSHLVLDACCLLNFAASGNLLSILEALPVQLVVTQVVQERELITLQQFREAKNDAVSQFEEAISKGVILVVDFETEAEEELFVNCVSALLDDGEAATCAISFQRGWAIATDDKRAISFIKQEAPHLQLLSTLDIIKLWSEQVSLDLITLRNVLHAIKVDGHYIPHKSHPLRPWWESALQP